MAVCCGSWRVARGVQELAAVLVAPVAEAAVTLPRVGVGVAAAVLPAGGAVAAGGGLSVGVACLGHGLRSLFFFLFFLCSFKCSLVCGESRRELGEEASWTVL